MSLEMTLMEQLQTCRTPTEAFALLVSKIEALTARVQYLEERQPSDPWEVPLEWPVANPHDYYPTPVPEDLDPIVALRAAVAAETDPDELRVLKARLWLAENPGKIPEEMLDEGQRATVAGDDVVTPPPSKQRMEERLRFAIAYELHTFLPSLTEEDVRKVFPKGGARWLYYDGGRDAVMAMPYAARQWLCEDIAVDSQQEAAEVARDILKQQASVDMNTAVDALNRMSGAE